jgi:hypothetical protein
MDSETAVVAGYRKHGDDVMGYVVGYLIPFVGYSLTSRRQDIALLIFLLLLAYLYTTTDMIHINPMLHLLRYNVYEVTFQQGIVRRVVTKKRVLRRDDELHLVPLSDDLWLDKGD